MTGRRLRALVITPTLPFPPTWGFAARVFHLWRELAEQYDITMIGEGHAEGRKSPDGAVAEWVRELCVVPPRGLGRRGRRWEQARALVSTLPYGSVAACRPALQRAVDEVLATRTFDLVQLESSHLAPLRLDGRAPVVLDEHNIEYELVGRTGSVERSAGRRAYSKLEHAKTRRSEERLWASVQGCAMTSEREASVVRPVAANTPTAVVPNGVDVDYFTPAATPAVPDTVVFVGLLTYRPNLDAARHLVDDVLPALRRLRPGVRLTIIGHGAGRDLAALRRPGVEVTGWVPDTRPYLASASVAVVPIRAGSGTRLKVLEALAMGKAIVSTAVGCEGLDIEAGAHLLVADGATAFAASVASVLASRHLQARMGKAGRALVVERYSWATCAEQLAALHERVFSSRWPTAAVGR